MASFIAMATFIALLFASCKDTSSEPDQCDQDLLPAEPLTSFDNILDMHFVSVSKGWILLNSSDSAGTFNAIMKTQDGGTTWRLQKKVTGNTLRRIFFVDDGYGWVTGQAATLLHTVDGGCTWATVQIPTTLDLFAVHFVNRQHGFVTAGSNSGPGGILGTTDGGINWSVWIDSAAYGSYVDIAFSGNRGIAVGGDIHDNLGRRAVALTSDGGATWSSSVPTPSLSALFHVGMRNDSIILATPFASESFMKTTDGGHAWSEEPISSWIGPSPATAFQIRDFVVLSNGSTIVLDSSAIASSNDLGRTCTLEWEAIQWIPGLRTLFFLDDNTGWAGGRGTIIRFSDGQWTL